MKTSPFPLVPHILCIAIASLAMPSPAHAGATDGLKQLIDVTQLKAQAANEQARDAAQKEEANRAQKDLVRAAQAQLERSAPQEDDASPLSHAGRVVDDVGAVVEFESTAGTDGLDDAESKRLAELVAAAQQRVEAATADASTTIANAKKLLQDTEATADKKRIKLHLKSLRATVKAHRQTAAALRALAKRLPR
jgi:hypothetical protein